MILTSTLDYVLAFSFNLDILSHFFSPPNRPLFLVVYQHSHLYKFKFLILRFWCMFNIIYVNIYWGPKLTGEGSKDLFNYFT